MGFFANLKAKREAKQAQAAYDLKLLEWTQDHDALTKSLDIFTGASKSVENLIKLNAKSRKTEKDLEEISRIENELNQKVYDLYQLPERDRKLIDLAFAD